MTSSTDTEGKWATQDFHQHWKNKADEYYKDMEVKTPEDILIEQEEEEELATRAEELLSALDEREQKIIQDRYLSSSPKTLAELADELGVNQQRVNQLEQRAFDKLNRKSEAMG